jgi:secondary thiamine-phosphate synthase enzyme
MIQHQYQLSITTPGRGMIDVTSELNQFIRTANVSTGLLHVFIHHTSASVVICENASPQVQADFETFMQRISPDNDPDYLHDEEGPDDMPAHVRTMLTQSFLVIPVTDKKLALGQWQNVYLWEHRLTGRDRKLTVTIQGL